MDEIWYEKDMVLASSASGTESPKRAANTGPASSGQGKKLLGMTGTFLTVAVLTGLLWVWADQSQQVVQEIRLSFVLATEAESSLILLGVDDGSGQVPPATDTGGRRVKAKVKFSGTRSRLRELQTDLQSGGLELLAYISAGSYWATADKIAVIDLLNANDELRDRGVTVVQAEPANITVDLNEWVDIDRIKLALRNTAESQKFQARIDPPEIAVQVPSSLKDALPEELLVELGQIPEKITPNLTLSGTVQSKLAGQPIRPKPAKVTVILQPSEHRTISLRPLQITVGMPAEMIGVYDLEWKNPASKFVEVKVEGPTAELDKLKSAVQEKVRARIDLGLTHAMPTEAFYQVTVQFEFIGVHGVNLAGPERTVKVRLKRKPTSHE